MNLEPLTIICSPSQTCLLDSMVEYIQVTSTPSLELPAPRKVLSVSTYLTLCINRPSQLLQPLAPTIQNIYVYGFT